MVVERQRCCASEDGVRSARRHDDESGGFLASVDAALLLPTRCNDVFRSVCGVSCAVRTQVQRQMSSSTAIISSILPRRNRLRAGGLPAGAMNSE